ncbi:MAG: four helix bundle protein [bacterium]|nr:four helix bundle protein [bacterium]
MAQLSFHNNSFKPGPPQRNFSNANLPVLQKTAEVYKLWHNILPHIPRLTLYSLGEKINLLFIELAELIFMAGFAAKENKILIIKKASLKLDMLKFFIQIAWELKAIDNKKFAELSSPLIEIGKMLGGWQRQLIKETPPIIGGVRK